MSATTMKIIWIIILAAYPVFTAMRLYKSGKRFRRHHEAFEVSMQKLIESKSHAEAQFHQDQVYAALKGMSDNM